MDRTRFQFSLESLLLVSLLCAGLGYSVFLVHEEENLKVERARLKELLDYIDNPNPAFVYLRWDVTQHFLRYVIPAGQEAEVQVRSCYVSDWGQYKYFNTEVAGRLRGTGTLTLQAIHLHDEPGAPQIVWVLLVNGERKEYRARDCGHFIFMGRQARIFSNGENCSVCTISNSAYEQDKPNGLELNLKLRNAP